MSQTHPPLQAILYALAGFTCWVTGDTFFKLAAEMKIPGYQIMTLGSFGGIVTILLVTTFRGKLEKLKPHRYDGLAALGLMFVINYFLYLIALPQMPLANFYSIIFMAPILVAVMAAVIFDEILNWKMTVASLVGFLGVIIAINPGQFIHDEANWVGYAATFASMLVFTMQMLTLRFLSRHESRECMAFYPRLFPLVLGLGGIAIWGFQYMTPAGWIFCFSSGGVGGIGWLLMAKAYKTAPASTVAPFQYSEIITGALFGYLIWHHVPSFELVVGASIIIASGIYVVTHARKTSQLVKVLKENP